MFHRILIALIRIIANTFFRRIDVVGIENVPADGPVIFAGNHPNALMDGFLLIAKCGRWPLHFMVSAKLWEYRLLAPALNATGAVPVYRREDHDGEIDNQSAFEKLYEVIESGKCMGIFPEGISHAESQLVKLKTGTARIALSVTARGKASVKIIPCGLNYINRHRFRSQVLIEFGAPIVIDDQWVQDYRQDEQGTVRKLTEHLSEALSSVTLNAPDWRTLRFIQTGRRLYKPASADLSPGEYVELNRRFVDGYLRAIDDPEMQAFRDDVENYQARLDMLGLKDYQLRKEVTLGWAFRKVFFRSLNMLALLPLAIPGALLHLPVGWIAATVGEKFSYEMDDIATLKVFSTILLLPLLYLVIAIVVGINFGFWWAIVAVMALLFSSIASVRLIEAEVGLLVSLLSVLRLTRLGSEIDDLRATRAILVSKIRALTDRLADPELQRLFTDKDFSQPENEQSD
ncbi:MAG: lysophospholipid acyltransferase family protein [Gammaproteobacteria bacterium]|nr:lysophospholipid acyltransferase family protein [Gammaproteobacteria bacterium]